MTQTSNNSANNRTDGSWCHDLAGMLDHRLFKALCDPSRLGILCRVAQRRSESTVSEVAACCPTNISVVSRHLAMLRDAGILHAEKRGKEVYYSVRCSELAATLRASTVRSVSSLSVREPRPNETVATIRVWKA